MPRTSVRHFFGVHDEPLIDGWLCFTPAVNERYEKEWGARRRIDLRVAVFVGVIIYNVYNITSIALLPDVLLLSIVLRMGVVTPVSLVLVWLIDRIPLRHAEHLMIAGILNAFLVPVFLFWWSAEPSSLLTFADLSLTVVFANTLLALRFLHAVLVTAAALAVAVVAVLGKAGLDAPLRFAFCLQFAAACIFSLFANYRSELRRCTDYLITLNAGLAAEKAEAARQEFQDLSRTDALTRLPNRRHLTERLNAWFAEPGSIALLMIDVDHFKLYNDALGHPAGDECLRLLARAFAEKDDTDRFSARFGGEEFIVAVRGTTELEAVRLAKGLVQSIEALAIPHPSRSDGFGVVTVSVGVGLRSNGDAASQADVLASADRALYLAKHRGRNRFALEKRFTDPLAQSA